MILIGMFGSLMVILLFSRKPLSESPCSIYLMINGILSFFFLPVYYFPVIMALSFRLNLLALNGSICRFQTSYATFTVTSVLGINFLILLDRYAISSRSVRIRSWSSKKMRRYFILVVLTLSCLLIGIPTAIFFENVPSRTNGLVTCTSKSRWFLFFVAFFYFPILEGVLPIVLAICFWFITRRQVRTLNNQEFIRRFDKQMSRMCFIQIVLHAMSSVPFAAYNLYRSLTSEVIRSTAEENLFQFLRLLTIFLFYIQYSTDFYVYLFTSAEIRLQTKNILCLSCPHGNNRVAPAQGQIHAFAKQGKVNITPQP